MSKVTLDYSPGSVLAVCGCGWRDIFTGRGPALRAAAEHTAGAHDDWRHAGKLRERYGRLTAG